MIEPFSLPAELVETPEEEIVSRIKVLETNSTFGKFSIEPLERGHGITIGTPLRRILLSSIPGTAVTWVKIGDVLHEYASVPRVKEEVMEILQNVKGIRIASSSERPGKMRLEVTGEGRVCAGDIATSSEFKIVNPDLHLLTLDSPDASIYIEFNVEQGKGYQYTEHGEGLPVGVMPVDAIFSPVRKVNYSVEMTRVGQTTDYERLILEIRTDGAINPMEALKKASEILINHFFLCSTVDKDPEDDESAVTFSSGVPIEILQTPIEKLDLSPRTYNCLKRAHIDKVGEVLEKSKSLLEIRNFGTKSMTELQSKLKELGIVPGNEDNEVDPDGEVSDSNGQTED